jgi:hypothetical protein
MKGFTWIGVGVMLIVVTGLAVGMTMKKNTD